jgi:hypothetical protein
MIRDFEKGRRMPLDELEAIRSALEAEGVEFIARKAASQASG